MSTTHPKKYALDKPFKVPYTPVNAHIDLTSVSDPATTPEYDPDAMKGFLNIIAAELFDEPIPQPDPKVTNKQSHKQQVHSCLKSIEILSKEKQNLAKALKGLGYSNKVITAALQAHAKQTQDAEDKGKTNHANPKTTETKEPSDTDILLSIYNQARNKN